jgi:hypothetical protein
MKAEEILWAADVHDPTIVHLLQREQDIRDELSRRKALLMHDPRSAPLPSPASRTPTRARVTEARVRRAGARGGPGGPGLWDD